MNMVIERITPMALILLSGAFVALADGLIKRASINQSNLVSVLQNPLMIWVGLIYALAIVVFGLVFLKQWDLGIVGLLQIIVYAAAVVLGGIVFFHERLTIFHGLGLGLALVAVILLNI